MCSPLSNHHIVSHPPTQTNPRIGGLKPCRELWKREGFPTGRTVNNPRLERTHLGNGRGVSYSEGGRFTIYCSRICIGFVLRPSISLDRFLRVCLLLAYCFHTHSVILRLGVPLGHYGASLYVLLSSSFSCTSHPLIFSLFDNDGLTYVRAHVSLSLH